jgi:tyrosyl-tRNA synthetase
VGRFLRLFTELPLDEIARLEALEGAEINEAKKVLATEATALAHGRAAAEQAAETARLAFEEGAAAESLPTYEVPNHVLEAGIPLVRLLAESGLVSSNGEARRLIRGGGARLNDEPVRDEGLVISDQDFKAGPLKLSAGRKQHRIIRPSA